MDSYAVSLAFVLAREGGFVDDPDDPGGATNLGVTQATYNAWRKKRHQPTRFVRDITRDEAAALYREDYWNPVRGDELSAPVALAVFDFAVNAGVGRAIRTLQAAAGTAQDGVFGPKTLAAVLARDPKGLARHYCQLREAFYEADVRQHPRMAKYLHGWQNRVKALREEIEHL